MPPQPVFSPCMFDFSPKTPRSDASGRLVVIRMAKPAAAPAAAAPADRTLELSGISASGLPGLDSKRSANGPGTHSPKGRRYSQKAGRGPTGPPRTPGLEEGPATGLPPKGPSPARGSAAKRPSPSRPATAATPATATRDARAQQEKDQAATRLQAVRRGSVARRGSHAAEKEKEAAAAAARKVQALKRGNDSRRQQQRQRQEKDRAAVRLQAVRRGSVARRDAAVRTAPASGVQGPLRVIEAALAAHAGCVIDRFLSLTLTLTLPLPLPLPP